MKPTVQEIASKLTKDLSDAGKVIEGGFAGFRLLVIPRDAPQIQVDEMRMAFFGGAQHLFASIMNILDPGLEPSDADLRRMDLIDAELRSFEKEFALKHVPTDGNA